MARKGRIIILLTAISLTVSTLTGCATLNEISSDSPYSSVWEACSADIFGEEEQAYTQISVSFPRHSGYAPTADKTAYASLKTEKQRQAYLSIEESIFRVTEESGGENGKYALCRALIPSLTSAEIFMVKEAVIADHPEAFWVNGKYTLGRNMKDGDFISLYSTCSAQEIPEKLNAISKRIAELLREIPTGLNDYDRELIIHDCIVRDVEYDVAATENTSPDDDAVTIYGALVNGKAICSGYSRAVKLLLNRVGISCSTVKGISKNVGHMWNLVHVDGDWYHLDVTWDDPVNYAVSDMNSYSYYYFNLTDAEIMVDHDIADGYEHLTEEVIQKQDENALNFYNFDMPACSATAANFYLRNALKVNVLNDSGRKAVIDRMLRMDGGQEDIIYVAFPGEMNAEVLSKWMDEVIKEGWVQFNAASGGKKISRCIITYSMQEEEGENRKDTVFAVKFFFR